QPDDRIRRRQPRGMREVNSYRVSDMANPAVLVFKRSVVPVARGPQCERHHNQGQKCGEKPDCDVPPSQQSFKAPIPMLLRRRKWSNSGIESMLVSFNSAAHTCKTSPSRATNSYSTGLTKKPRKNRESKPATITMAKGFCVSEPMPVESAAGRRPRQATSAVIMIGRRRSSEASRVAVRISLFSSRSLLIYETRITAVSTETPISASSPSTEETLKGVCVSFNAISAPTGSVIITPSAIVTGNLKLP